MISIGPGMRVLCIRDDWFGQAFGEALPVQGVIYTVREVIDHDDVPHIRLNEIVNPEIVGLGEVMFYLSFFKPLDEPGLDILRQLAKFPSRELVPV